MGATVEADAEEAAHRMIAAARWPDGLRCPKCHSDSVTRRQKSRPAWRCGDCRADFTVTTDTALHASKAPLAAWVRVAVEDAAPFGVSDTTARNMRRVVESTGLSPGAERLAALLTSRVDAAARGPLVGVSAGQRKILGMLRTRAAGATPGLIASETGLSSPHVRRCLRALRAEGFVESETVSVMWGYRPHRLTVWRLAMNKRTIAALPQMGWRPPAQEQPPTGVPGEFWWLFWSGTCASLLRIPEDAVHIADTLIGGPDPSARAWAMECLPLWALRTTRTMRGYDTGEAARALDFAINTRRDHDG